MTWWKRPWVAPLGFVVLVFLAFSIPPYLSLDPAQSRVPATWAGHYPLLVVHVLCGSVALATCGLQVWPWFRSRFPVWHRRIGRVYFFAGVFPAGLTGLVVGATTPFGPVAGTSNVMLATLWLLTSVTGYRMARQRRFGDHRRWMIRSFALTASIISNRIWGVVAYLSLMSFYPESEIGPLVAGISTWLGWTVPLLLSQWWLERRNPARKKVTTEREVSVTSSA
ncbi:DUF2306 domain-containing protein [Lentzea tibetensis]|uniref:DUF2306 domain-containing protein n=1 Tax=Lentzea tibetensis TaxID=2591470 RepID=A0A563F0D4_9PSEU|nr:DUF2306 domain-containing protein [Lentzea tibetensis]TWP53353.1 DUF2306 domain-containing protein [Lentzea tibetensis]